MAKPRVVKLKGAAQATLLYMSEEKADEYEKVLINYEKAKELATEEKTPLEGHVALGIHQNLETRHWELCTIKYNPITKESEIVDIKEAGISKNYASGKFKKAAIENGIV